MFGFLLVIVKGKFMLNIGLIILVLVGSCELSNVVINFFEIWVLLLSVIVWE